MKGRDPYLGCRPVERFFIAEISSVVLAASALQPSHNPVTK
jgi:hypothetical protein